MQTQAFYPPPRFSQSPRRPCARIAYTCIPLFLIWLSCNALTTRLPSCARNWKDFRSVFAKRRPKSSAPAPALPPRKKPTRKALQHEIANAEAEVAKAEDRQLEVMMAAEEAERRVKIAESRLKEAEQATAAERKEIQSQGAEKKKQLDAATAERERIIAPVPEELRELYARIAKRHNGTAMAEARDGQCRGCGMRVLPHILQELRAETNEEVFRCESCGLILYTLEPIPVANPAVGSANTSSAASTNS